MSRADSPATHSLAGWLLIGMLAVSIGSALFDAVPIAAASALAWLALLRLWPKLSRQQRVQTAVLIGLGAAGVLWGVMHGVDIEPARLLGQNQIIISMLASVTLLRLLNDTPDTNERPLPQGRAAYNRSVVGVQLFGAFINISALIIMADRLSRTRALSEAQALMLCRSFTMATFYSPFIGGMALALAYTPGSSLGVVALTGMPLALVGITILYLMGRMRWAGDLSRFPGYPVHFESLWLPAGLAGAVLLLHTLFPSLSVLTLVIMLSPVVVIAVLLIRQGLGVTARKLLEFVRQRLPEMGGELALFLGAGVLGAGLLAGIESSNGTLPFTEFGAAEASLTLASTIGAAFLGVHPVVMVTTAATVLGALAPDPNLLAMTFVMGWGIGCAACPLSGTNLALRGRYQVSNWRLARKNVPYCVLMTLAGSALMHLFEVLSTGAP